MTGHLFLVMTNGDIFPSGAVAWRINNEEFMRGISTISNLKLRASYGVTGSQAVGPYSSLATLSTDIRYAPGGGAAITGVGLGTIQFKIKMGKNGATQHWI